ncbi:NUDIX domain-containing protein [Candidatus Curtissbacteria bacterium]|nr:NUDIX domain-containing protein [Candidatus Curtissbacteria bacterium]
MKTGEIYDVVDKRGRKIGSATWVECHTKGLLHQAVHGILFKDKSRKEVLIKRRSLGMVQGPGQWEIAVAGHMISGDTPKQAILKEIEEELFCENKVPSDIIVKRICSYFNNDILDNHEIAYLFEIIYPGPFYIDQEESSGEPKWVNLMDLVNDTKFNPKKYAQFSINAINTYLSRSPQT